MGYWWGAGYCWVYDDSQVRFYCKSTLQVPWLTSANVQRHGDQVGLHRRRCTRFPYYPHHPPDIQVCAPLSAFLYVMISNTTQKHRIRRHSRNTLLHPPQRHPSVNQKTLRRPTRTSQYRELGRVGYTARRYCALLDVRTPILLLFCGWSFI